MSVVAIVAGDGALPAAIGAALDRSGATWICRHLQGHVPEGIERSVAFRIEHLGSMLRQMSAEGVDRICFAGRIVRPEIDPGQLDAETIPLAATLAAAIHGGDDAGLRAVLSIVEAAGFTVVAPQEIAPDLTAIPVVGAPTQRDLRDVKRARTVIAALGSVDVGQGCVVAHGQVLAVEALPGTDWMLRSLWQDAGRDGPGPFARPPGGVFVKMPKPQQDRRIDLPTIGPDTVRNVIRAGLSGIAVEDGGALVLEGRTVAALAHEAGLFILALTP